MVVATFASLTGIVRDALVCCAQTDREVLGLMMIAVAAPLKRRDFRLFWLGQWISQFGDNVFYIAEVWLVYSMTGSPAAMATVALCGQIPAVGMILLGGALVDRLSMRQVALWSDVVRGTLVLLLAALLAAGALEVWHLYISSAVFGLVSAFARPAFRALIPALVPPEERTSTNSLVSAGAMAANIAGPPLGGLVMAWGDAPLAFLLNGLSFLTAAAGLALARPEEPARAPAQASGLRITALLLDLREALQLLWSTRFLLITIGFMAVINVTGQAVVVILRPWVARELAGGGAQTLSLAYTFFSVGMFGTLTALGTVKVTRHRIALIFGGILVAGVSMVGMGFVRAPWQLWALELILGAAVMIHGVLWQGLLQDTVPPAAMGRASAIDEFGSLVLYPAGLAAVGFLSTFPGGPQAVLLGGGALTGGVAVLALLNARSTRGSTQAAG